MEGYFPKGAPNYASGSRDSYVKYMVRELGDLAKREAQIAPGDLLGHLLHINKILKILPYSTSLMIDKAELLEALAQTDDDPMFKDAEALYRKAVEMEPGRITAKANLGLLLASGGRYAEAHPFLEEVSTKLMETLVAVYMALNTCQLHGVGDGAPGSVEMAMPQQ